MRSCTSLIGCLTLAAVLLALSWVMRGEIAELASGLRGPSDTAVEAAAATGPELGRQAERKIMALGQGEFDAVSLTPEELDGWVRYSLKGLFPEYVTDISAAVDELDRLVLSGRLIVRDIPGTERLPVGLLLGDTADVSVRGRLDGLEPGRGVLYVDGLQIGPLLLPEALRTELLEGMAEERRGTGGDKENLPANAITFDLPPFVSDIGVRGGELVLERS